MKAKLSKKINSFDWTLFSKLLKNQFIHHSKYSRLPINSDRWEEIIYHTLRDMGETYCGGVPRWDIGSHAPGADLWIDKFSISAKSGSIDKENRLIISSNRLTRFATLELMKEYIDGTAKNFDFYLCCSRRATKTDITYTIYLVDADVVNATQMNWAEMVSKNGVVSGWMGTSKNGSVLKIVKNMSNQLWLSIPVKLCSKITEISFPSASLGDTSVPIV